MKVTDIEKYKKIKFINCFSTSRSANDGEQGHNDSDEKILNDILYKYMPLSRVIEMLETSQMAFVSPELWRDPYETMFLKTDYTSLGEYHQPKQIYALCVRNDRHNAEPSWIVYANNEEPIVRCNIDLSKFLDTLENYASTKSCIVYISKVQYMPNTHIKNIAKSGTTEHAKFFGNNQNMSIETYIELLSLKRLAFEYEQEYRIFIVPDTSNQQGERILKIPISHDLIEKYIFEPLGRIDHNTTKTKVLIAMHEAEFAATSILIKTLSPKAEVSKSLLYRLFEPVNKIEN